MTLSTETLMNLLSYNNNPKTYDIDTLLSTRWLKKRYRCLKASAIHGFSTTNSQ